MYPRTIEVRDDVEAPAVEQALAMARELKQLTDAADDGEVLAVFDPEAHPCPLVDRPAWRCCASFPPLGPPRPSRGRPWRSRGLPNPLHSRTTSSGPR